MAMTNAEIWEAQKRERAFVATPIGAAFTKFRRALESAVLTDTNAGWGQNISDVKLKETWERARVAETELRALIEPIAFGNEQSKDQTP